MLNSPPAPAGGLSRPLVTVVLFTAAMVLGLLIAATLPGIRNIAAGVVESIIIGLVALLFFDVQFTGAVKLLRSVRTIGLVMVINFLIIPVLAFGLTALTVPEDEMLRLGVLIYLLFPCTDWCLGFVRVTGGNTVLGAALIPINLALQLMLYPVWISVFTGDSLGSVLSELGPALLTGVAVPAAIALAARLYLYLWAAPGESDRLRGITARVVPWVIAVMILCLFAAHGAEISASPAEFGSLLFAVFLFFLVTYLVIEAAAALFRLSYENHSLLTLTASARNAPLMLAVTSLTFGDHPVLLAAIVLGMLVEFPHLTALTWLLRRRKQRIALAA